MNKQTGAKSTPNADKARAARMKKEAEGRAKRQAAELAKKADLDRAALARAEREQAQAVKAEQRRKQDAENRKRAAEQRAAALAQRRQAQLARQKQREESAAILKKRQQERDARQKKLYDERLARQKLREQETLRRAQIKSEKQKEKLQRFTDKAGMPFYGALKIRVEGFNQARYLSELAAEGVKVLSITRHGAREADIVVSKKDSAKGFAILNKLCYNYKVTAESGISRLRFLAFRRIGAAAAALLLCAGLFVSQLYVWQVEVGGNERVPLSDIMAVVQQRGAGRGSKKSALDFKALKVELDKLDGILESTVSLAGNTLVVSVIEKTPTTPVNPGQTGEIVSQFDALVTNIEAESGTALVKVGGVVKKGDALIAPYVLDPDGNKRPVPAKGRVYGKVTRTKSVVLSAEKYKTVKTGKSYTYTAVGFKKLELKGKNKLAFKRYESVTSVVKPFSFLPLHIRQTRYDETELVHETLDIQSRADEVMAQCIPELRAGLSGTLYTSHSLVETGGGCYRLDIFVTSMKTLIGEAKG